MQKIHVPLHMQFPLVQPVHMTCQPINVDIEIGKLVLFIFVQLCTGTIWQESLAHCDANVHHEAL